MPRGPLARLTLCASASSKRHVTDAPVRIERFAGANAASEVATVVSGASLTTSCPGGRSTETTWPRAFKREIGIVTRGGRLRPRLRDQTVRTSDGNGAQPAGTWLSGAT